MHAYTEFAGLSSVSRRCCLPRGAGLLIWVWSIAPGFMVEPIVFDKDSAKKAPDVVDRDLLPAGEPSALFSV
jgi:hypothetical protein